MYHISLLLRASFLYFEKVACLGDAGGGETSLWVIADVFVRRCGQALSPITRAFACIEQKSGWTWDQVSNSYKNINGMLLKIVLGSRQSFRYHAVLASRVPFILCSLSRLT